MNMEQHLRMLCSSETETAAIKYPRCLIDAIPTIYKETSSKTSANHLLLTHTCHAKKTEKRANIGTFSICFHMFRDYICNRFC